MSLPKNTAEQPAWAPSTWGPRWSRIVAIVLCKALWKVEVHGEEHVPATGKILVAANHSGFVDGPLMLGVTPRPTHFLVKGSFFKGPLGYIMRGAGQISVVPGKGKDSLITARAVLHRGDAVGIFPEGRRGRGDVAALAPGVGWLALHTNTQVVPVAILGARRTGASVKAWPRFRAKIVVQFGEPVLPTDFPAESEIDRTDISQMTGRVQEAMQSLLQESQIKHNMFLPQDEGTKDIGTSNV